MCCLLIVVCCDGVLSCWSVLLPCESASLFLGLLKGQGVGNDAFGTRICFTAHRRHVVVGTHVFWDVELVVCVNCLAVVVGVAVRLGIGVVAVVGAVFGMAGLTVFVAQQLVEFVLGSG